jgi:hypothetical protein
MGAQFLGNGGGYANDRELRLDKIDAADNSET